MLHDLFNRMRPWSLAVALAGVLPGLACNGVRLPDPDVRYVAFGDSMTAGPTPVDYPQILAELLGEPADAFANEGRGGEPTDAGLERLNRLISNGIFPNAHTLVYWQGGGDLVVFLRAYDPALVLAPEDPGYPLRPILIETLDRVQINNESAVLAGQAAGWHVVLATYPLRPRMPLPCESLPVPIMLPEQVAIANTYTRLLNQRIRQAALNTGAMLVDIEADPRLPGQIDTFVDCNHPGEAGNRIIAELLAAALTGT